MNLANNEKKYFVKRNTETSNLMKIGYKNDRRLKYTPLYPKRVEYILEWNLENPSGVQSVQIM